MPNQDQGREYARAERPRNERPAKLAKPSPRSAETPGRSSESVEREASRRAQGVVARARRRVEERIRLGRRAEQGPFAGRGPKGYTRDDRRIREDVCDLLLADSEVDPSEVVVSVTRGEVTFDGTVADRATKHYVECIGAACLGVTGVQNNLRTPGMGRARAPAVDGEATPDETSPLQFDEIQR